MPNQRSNAESKTDGKAKRAAPARRLRVVPATAPSTRTVVHQPLPPGAHNVPARVTGFIGRAEGLARVVDLLESSPLVTVTGPSVSARPASPPRS